MYWDEFDSKYGFSDGTAIPRDAQQVREVYVMLINHKAKQLGSQHRVIPYNRISHNLFVIHRVPLSFFNTVTPQQLTDGLDGLPDDITDLGDDLLDEAIEWAKEQQPETYIQKDKMKATYVSVWNGGTKVRTICDFDPETKMVSNIEGTLDEQYIELPDGQEIRNFTNDEGQVFEDGEMVEDNIEYLLFQINFNTSDFAEKVIKQFNDNETKIPLDFSANPAASPGSVLVYSKDVDQIANAMSRMAACVRIVEHFDTENVEKNA